MIIKAGHFYPLYLPAYPQSSLYGDAGCAGLASNSRKRVSTSLLEADLASYAETSRVTSCLNPDQAAGLSFAPGGSDKRILKQMRM